MLMMLAAAQDVGGPVQKSSPRRGGKVEGCRYAKARALDARSTRGSRRSWGRSNRRAAPDRVIIKL